MVFWNAVGVVGALEFAKSFWNGYLERCLTWNDAGAAGIRVLGMVIVL